jgi:cytochrome c-type biogenesis protein CcmE
MNKLQKRRLYYLLIFACAIALAATLILYALKQNINVFFTPTQLINAKLKSDYHLRLGGVVKEKSVKREKNSLGVHFIITDFKNETAVYYVGVLPDLFREGKGVIAEGYINSTGTFIATQVLAKHDENYMPKNVYRQLRKNTQ